MYFKIKYGQKIKLSIKIFYKKEINNNNYFKSYNKMSYFPTKYLAFGHFSTYFLLQAETKVVWANNYITLFFGYANLYPYSVCIIDLLQHIDH